MICHQDMKNQSKKTKAIKNNDKEQKKKDIFLMQLQIEDDSTNNEESVIAQAQNPNKESRKLTLKKMIMV